MIITTKESVNFDNQKHTSIKEKDAQVFAFMNVTIKTGAPDISFFSKWKNCYPCLTETWSQQEAKQSINILFSWVGMDHGVSVSFD